MSAFERFGRKTAKEIGPFALIIGALVGLMALCARIPLIAQGVWGIVAIGLAVAAVSALVSITAVLWAVVAPAARFLGGFLPVRVWLTWGPPGGGPWLHSPAHAAEFIVDMSTIDADDNPDEGLAAVRFNPGELKPLWLPGRKLERNGWGIKCTVIQRRELSREWDGFSPMPALTQAYVDEDKRLRAVQYALFPRMKALPKAAVEQPQTLRADDAAAREGIIPGAGGKYPAKKRR